MRGLKLPCGKWLVIGITSHLTQVRGLKYTDIARRLDMRVSHLTQVRGLKFDINIHFYEPPEVVAPHAGAWIEIIQGLVNGITSMVAPHAGAWIEIVG